MDGMRTRTIAAGFGPVLLLLVVAAGCGDGDGERPDVTLPSTTSTAAGAAGTTTSTAETTTTTRPSVTVTTRPDEPTTTTTAAVTTTTQAVTTTVPTTTTTAPETTTTAEASDEAAAVPDADSEDDSTSWWWLLIPLLLALVGFLLWRRSKSAPPWSERAAAFAAEVDAAGHSVLLGPDLTDELWTTALTRSNAVRAEANDLLDHAPTTAARQAVSEAVEALRQAEVQATAARSGVGGTGDRDAAAIELTAAVQRLQAVATPPVPPAP